MTATPPPTTWSVFGPDSQLVDLPAAMQACLPPGQPSQACDQLIGSAAQGYGFCADPAYRQMTYCACVNSSAGCPQRTMPQCANAASSYKPWAWYQPGPGGAPSADSSCAASPVCVDIVDVGSGQNTVSGLSQQCGTLSNVTSLMKANPELAAITIVLLVALIAAALGHSNSAAPKQRPPPAAHPAEHAAGAKPK